jgi:hypothetical protein
MPSCFLSAVVVGLLLAFFALTFNMRLKPYSDVGLNFVSQVSQLNLLAFLFVALLLKVNLDGEGDNSFFSFIVGIMSIVRQHAPEFATCVDARFPALGANCASGSHQGVAQVLRRRPSGQDGAQLLLCLRPIGATP